MSTKVSEHVLVPEHRKLNKEETKALLDKYNITIKELPKILNNDPAINHLKSLAGDVIMISRKSQTAGKATYYRVVIRG